MKSTIKIVGDTKQRKDKIDNLVKQLEQSSEVIVEHKKQKHISIIRVK